MLQKHSNVESSIYLNIELSRFFNIKTHEIRSIKVSKICNSERLQFRNIKA